MLGGNRLWDKKHKDRNDPGRQIRDHIEPNVAKRNGKFHLLSRQINFFWLRSLAKAEQERSPDSLLLSRVANAGT